MKIFLFAVFSFLLLPFSVFAGVVVNEIMYDLEGSDTIDGKSREWVEIFNGSNAEINLSGWKFNDGDNATNHLLNEPPKNGGQGSLVVPSTEYAILVSDATVFLSDHQNYSGTVIDTVMSLNNASTTLKLINAEGSEVYSIAYDKTMGANGDGNSLQYADGKLIAANPTPGAVNFGSSQPPFQQQPQSQISGGGSSQYIPPEQLPKIKADAGEDKTAVAGALVEFRGMAFGFDNKPLANARYLWNFGDGATKEGQNVSYSYRYPGNYSAVLDTASGEYAASDRLAVKVVVAEIFISEVKPGKDSFIEIYNNSKEELNISGWQISFGTQSFFFPKGSYIRPQSYLVILSSISGINLTAGKGLVRLSYVGGFAANAFNYEGVLTEGQSFSRQGEGSVITKETPGSVNILAAPVGAIVKKEIVSVVVKENKISDGKDKETVSGAAVPPKENSPANVFSATKESNSSGGTKLYFFAVLGLVVFAGVGVFLIRRYRGS